MAKYIAKELERAPEYIERAIQKAYGEPMYRVIVNPVHGCFQLGTMTRFKKKNTTKRNGLWVPEYTDQWAIVPTQLIFPPDIGTASASAFVNYMREVGWVHVGSEAQIQDRLKEKAQAQEQLERDKRQAEMDEWSQWGKDFDRSFRALFSDFWGITPDRKSVHKRVDRTLARKEKYIETGDHNYITAELYDRSEGSLLEHYDRGD